MKRKDEREYHFILVFNSRSGEWYLDVDSEGVRFPEGNIWNATTQEWELGYLGDDEYTEGEQENTEKVMKAIAALNRKERAGK